MFSLSGIGKTFNFNKSDIQSDSKKACWLVFMMQNYI